MTAVLQRHYTSCECLLTEITDAERIEDLAHHCAGKSVPRRGLEVVDFEQPRMKQEDLDTTYFAVMGQGIPASIVGVCWAEGSVTVVYDVSSISITRNIYLAFADGCGGSLSFLARVIRQEATVVRDRVIHCQLDYKSNGAIRMTEGVR